MITVETQKREITEEDGSTTEKEFLIINGIPDEQSFFGRGEVTFAHLYNEDVIDSLINNSFNEIGQHFSNISFELDQDWWEDWITIHVYCSAYFKVRIPSIEINLQIQAWEDWAKPWSISSVAKEFEICVNELSNEQVKYWQQDEDSILNGFGIKYYPTDGSLIVDAEICKIFAIIEILVDKTNRRLLASLDKDSILTYFQFPNEIKTAAKQYLVYFAQFLLDIGIEAETEIREELHETLFKIIPKDKGESLERIKEALELFLNMPGMPNVDAEIAKSGDIAAMQLQANILHLKGQMMLMQAAMQMKDATIESLQLSNYQLKEIAGKKEAEKLKTEDLIPGVVAVTKLEGKGLSINLPEILRRLKRRF